ncbi:ankyrin repeat-containing protein ITN1-like [Argentina anserina]|uniref:ankyrin repeat-containing protein ITN1-like n=1 Tax=Argentina anserina TaxID=57926 RepID=UPI0021762E3B|nr:ankyrin repeat-containing protein ITN1-like [Potentilla anserina]
MFQSIRRLPLEQMQGGLVQNAMLQAIECGNVEFVRKMCDANFLVYMLTDGKGKQLLHYSIECRQDEIYCLLSGSIPRNAREQYIVNGGDKLGNTILHSAGSLSPVAIAHLNRIQGAALQVQRELQWFKVNSIVPPKVHEMQNYQDRMTARELFTKNHKEIVEDGERQMKEIATSSTVVGALIVTMMFASAFTVPGGTNGDTGMPVFKDRKMFTVFIVSNAISLFVSTTSVVIFLGILTSRYAEDDFLISLPTKLVMGLSTLFFSIATTD